MFVPPAITVNETVGVVTIRVEATGAELARDVNVAVFTESGSASSKLNILLLL